MFKFMRIKLFFICIIILSLFQSFASDNKNRKPNILFFLVDDMGWMDAGYKGSEFYETPHIDQMASDGMRFQNAYASHPRCVPSRYALITGKYPARAQMPGPEKGGDESTLKKSEGCFAKILYKEGYSTFFAGKWHLATLGTFPEDMGFEKNIAGGHAGSPISYFYPYNVGRGQDRKKPILGLDEGSVGEYLTDRITNETIDYLESHFKKEKDKPFFAYVSHYAVHDPFEAKKEYIKKFSDKLMDMSFEGPEFIIEGTGTTKMHQNDPIYAAMLYSMDESLGRIVETLRQYEELDNTIIIFFSDNGGFSNRGSRARRVATSNYPLRAGKGHLYEGGIKEPMIVKWPGVTKAGSISDDLVIGTDFFPTILEMAGVPLKPEVHKDGRSFLWALKNESNPNPDRAVFWHSPIGRPLSTGDKDCSAIRKGDYKLIEWYKQNRIELYNLKMDEQEQVDLSTEEPEIVKEMLIDLYNWRRSVNAFMK